MRSKRGQRKRRTQAGRIALGAIGACALAVGCQEPQLDHVDGSTATFNANRIPSVDNTPATAAAPSGAIPSGTTQSGLAQSGITQSGTAKDDPSAAAVTPAGFASQSPAAARDVLIAENLNRGHREAALNHLEQAEVYYRRVLESQPDNPVANHRLAVIADKKRDFAKAEQYYLTALRRDARNADLLGDLGYSYLLQGRRAESERYLLAATRVDPSHAKALHNLSLLYAMQGDYDRSFDALRRAVGDSEARVKIVRLFPNGRPPAPEGGPMVATFEPSEAPQNGPAASIATPPDNGLPAVTADSGSMPGANSPPLPPSIGAAEPLNDFPAPSGSTTAMLPAPTAASPMVPAPVSAMPTGRVPDSQINDAFSAIDRESPHIPGEIAPDMPSTAPQSGPRPPATKPQTGSAAINGGDASNLEATPGADPLGSMPMWTPPASAAAKRKPPEAFLFNDEEPAPVPNSASKNPRAVATGVVPTGANAAGGHTSPDDDLLSEFEADLKKQAPATSDGRTQSNAGPVRDPLTAARPVLNRFRRVPPPLRRAPLCRRPRSRPLCGFNRATIRLLCLSRSMDSDRGIAHPRTRRTLKDRAERNRQDHAA